MFPEEICLAVKQTLSDPPIMVPDESIKGNQVSVQVEPKYISPDAEITEVRYPSLVLFETHVYPDYSRREAGEKIIDNLVLDSGGLPVSMDSRDVPEPYIVLIDVRFYGKYNIQRDIVRHEIYKRFSIPHGYLKVGETHIPLLFSGERTLSENREQDSGVYNEGDSKINMKGTQWRFRARTRFDVASRHKVYVVRDVIEEVIAIEG